MTVGNIAVGPYGETARQYMLEGGATSMKRYRVNSQATKMGQGIKKYEDEEFWDYWTQEDWQAGVGRLEPDAGGFLYGEVETRVPSQIILPAAVGLDGRRAAGMASINHMPTDSATYKVYRVGSGQAYEKLAVQITSLAVMPGFKFSFWARFVSGLTCTVTINSDHASHYPDTAGETMTVTETDSYMAGIYHWVMPATSGTTWATTANVKWFVIAPGNSVMDIIVGAGYSSTYQTKYYASSAWSSIPDSNYAPVYAYCNYGGVGSIRVEHLVNTPSGIYALVNELDTTTYYSAAYSYSAGVWSTVGTRAACPDNTAWGGGTYEGAYFNGVTYIPFDSDDYNTLTSTTYAAVASGGTGFKVMGGYLYRAVDNTVYYTGDGSTWSGPFTICQSSMKIRGMAEMGGEPYFACDDGLYWLAPGDFTRGVTPWNTIDSSAGLHMVNWRDALYIPVNGRVIQYSASGGVMDVWITKDDDIPSSRIGKIWALAATNLFLFALVGNDSTGTYPYQRQSVWAYNGQGWHFVASLPLNNYRHLAYDRVNSRLWIAGDSVDMCYLSIPDYALNPYNVSTSTYMPTGWIEWDWFEGAIKQSSKDFESVTIITENISDNNQEIDVYWRDDASTAWELLGTVDSENETLRWSSYATRPNTKKLKLGMELRTLANTETPRIKAIVVRFLTNVTDRYGWNLRIQVSANTVFLDGAVQTYTVAQQQTHLDALEVQTPPFPFTDNQEATTYEVRIMQASRDTIQHVYNGSTHTTDYVYNWVIEETT